MGTWRFTTPDGTVVHADGANEDEALNNAKVMWNRVTGKPGRSQNVGRSPADQATYLKELAKDRASLSSEQAPKPGWGGRVQSALVGLGEPFSSELNGLMMGGGNAVANAGRTLTGQPTVSSAAIHDAARDATREANKRVTDPNPYSAMGGSILGLLTGGEELRAAGAAGKGLLAPIVAAKAPAVAKAAAIPARTAMALKTAAAPFVKPQILDYAGNVAKAGLTGGATGGGLGFLNGVTPDERTQDALAGMKSGALWGTAFQGLGVPAMNKVGAIGSDILRGVKGAVMPAEAAGGDVGQAQEQARQQVANLSRLSGTTADNLPGKIAPYAGLGHTVAEANGSTGVNWLAALSRKAGATGDKVRTQMFNRARAQPNAILNDVKTQLKIDPQSDIDSLVKGGEAAATPAWRQAYENSAEGVDDVEVNRLLATPLGQKYMKGIQQSAANTGTPSHALGFGDVEVPRPGEWTDPGEGMPDDPNGIAGVSPNFVPKGPARPPSKGMSLMQFVSRKGGMSDKGVHSVPDDVKNWNQKFFSSGHQPETGLSDEDLAEKAWDAGFFPDHPDGPPDPGVFMNALTDDASGRNFRFAKQPDQGAMWRFLAKNFQEEGEAKGAFDAPPPEEGDYGNMPAPQDEPAFQLNPTGRTLDIIRRRANAAVEKDDFGKPVTTGDVGLANEDARKFAGDFSDAVAGKPGSAGGAVRGLREAMDLSSEPLGMKSAQANIQNLITGSSTDFNNVWSRLKPGGETLAAKTQIGNDLMELWGAGQLKAGKFANPNIRQNLQTAFGDDVHPLLDQIERRGELAATGSRMAPYGGSPTMTLGEASKDLEGGSNVDDVAPIIGKLASGNWLGAGTQAVGKGLKYVATTSGKSQAYNDELGRLLALPSDDPEYLDILNNYQPKPLNQATAIPAGAVAGVYGNYLQPGQ